MASGVSSSNAHAIIVGTGRVACRKNREFERRSYNGSLERMELRSRLSGETHWLNIRNLFLFVGADPATAWLGNCGVILDRAGFVVTGTPSEGRAVPALQTSVPGIFAVGDVRAGSVKRVGGAIGEGAQVVAALHAYFDDATPGL